MLSANLTAACQPPASQESCSVFAYEKNFPRRIVVSLCHRISRRSGANSKPFAIFRNASAYYPNGIANAAADPAIAAAHLSTAFAKQ
jgi:hypothetical protein